MLNEIVYLNPSRQTNNYGVNGYGTEAQNMMIVAKKVKAVLDSTGIFKAVHLTENLTLSQAIADSNGKGATIHLDIHSDAGGGRGCTGIYKSTNGKRLASLVYKYVSAQTPSEDRGLSYRGDLGCLNQTNAVAALIECFFHDNVDDVKFYNTHLDAIAKAIAEGILEYVGVVKVVASPPVNSGLDSAVKPSDDMYGVVTASVLNVRCGASGSNSVIGKLAKGTKVKIGFKENGWYNIYYGDRGGFVSADFVKVEPVNRLVTATSLNVRNGASTYYTAIGTLKQGEIVKVGSFTKNGWANIFYGDRGGFVSGDYLK